MSELFISSALKYQKNGLSLDMPLELAADCEGTDVSITTQTATAVSAPLDIGQCALGATLVIIKNKDATNDVYISWNSYTNSLRIKPGFFAVLQPNEDDPIEVKTMASTALIHSMAIRL